MPDTSDLTTRPRSTGRRRSHLRAVDQNASAEIRFRQRELFVDTLRAEPSKRGKPYSEWTIRAYLDAVDSLARWLTEIEHPDGFDTLTVHDYNAYMTQYLKRNTLGGTVTKQGNLRVFLRHIAEEYDTENVWEHPKRHRYGRAEDRPPVLAADLIRDLLKVTSGKSFHDRRDHAIIRVLLSGPRRTEVASMAVEDLDLTSVMRSAGVAGLKGRPSRRVPLGDRDVLALKRWLVHRSRHRRIRKPDEGPLWIVEKTGARLAGGGIYQMLRRRAVEAGYQPSVVRPHLFRHTFVHEAKAGQMNDGDIMAIGGWKDRSMLDRYGASLAEERALEAFSQSRFGDRH